MDGPIDDTQEEDEDVEDHATEFSPVTDMGTELGGLFDNIHTMYKVCALEYPQ
jgi:hypothetical protein